MRGEAGHLLVRLPAPTGGNGRPRPRPITSKDSKPINERYHTPPRRDGITIDTLPSNRHHSPPTPSPIRVPSNMPGSPKATNSFKGLMMSANRVGTIYPDISDLKNELKVIGIVTTLDEKGVNPEAEHTAMHVSQGSNAAAGLSRDGNTNISQPEGEQHSHKNVIANYSTAIAPPLAAADPSQGSDTNLSQPEQDRKPPIASHSMAIAPPNAPPAAADPSRGSDPNISQPEQDREPPIANMSHHPTAIIPSNATSAAAGPSQMAYTYPAHGHPYYGQYNQAPYGHPAPGLHFSGMHPGYAPPHTIHPNYSLMSYPYHQTQHSQQQQHLFPPLAGQSYMPPMTAAPPIQSTAPPPPPPST